MTDARSLRTGQKLRESDGDVVPVVSVRTWHQADTRVYNFTVADLHTYYVFAGEPVLVHNESPCQSWELDDVEGDWDRGTFPSARASAAFHFRFNRRAGQTIREYTDEALKHFRNYNKSSGRKHKLKAGGVGRKVERRGNVGIYTTRGKVVTYKPRGHVE